jgi:glucose-6-phosphate 1-epimerase
MSTAPSSDLNEKFGLDGVLHFDEHGSLTRANVTLPSCRATLYLQGAHLTHWQPAGQKPVLFLSEHSAFTPGKAIRGGVPICFPWFGPRSDGGPGPMHGFARIQVWDLAFAALLPDAEGGDRLQLTFTLGPSEASREVGFDDFRVAYEVSLGHTLSMRLTVANSGAQPLRFEEALHSYFAVADVRHAPITGLGGATYLDKRDEAKQKTAPDGPLQLTAFSDRVFPHQAGPNAIHDEGNQRVIQIDKQNSATTVVWNPWVEGAAPMADLGNDEWPYFLCVEAANTASDAIEVPPGETHTLAVEISVKPAT